MNGSLPFRQPAGSHFRRPGKADSGFRVLPIVRDVRLTSILRREIVDVLLESEKNGEALNDVTLF